MLRVLNRGLEGWRKKEERPRTSSATALSLPATSECRKNIPLDPGKILIHASYISTWPTVLTQCRRAKGS